jgi:hypothetical protein
MRQSMVDTPVAAGLAELIADKMTPAGDVFPAGSNVQPDV